MRYCTILLMLLGLAVAQPTPRKTFPYMDSGPASSMPGSCVTPSFYNAIDTGAVYVCQNGTYVAVSSVGGGVSGSPAKNTQVAGNGSSFAAQIKPVYDVRDWMTCDTAPGTSTGTDVSGGMSTLLSAIGSQEATVRLIGSGSPSNTCRVGNNVFPANITLDFSGGGGITLISSTTPVGNAVFVNATSAECGAGTTCATPALAVSAGNTLVADVMLYPGFTFLTSSVTDSCGNSYFHVFQSLASQPRNQGMWVASNANAGSCVITATANGSATTQQIIVSQFSGMGPVVSADGQGASTNSTGTTMSSGAAATTAGSLLVACGGPDHFFTETVTAGAGFTQSAQTTNGYLQCEYQLASAGGSVTATANLTVNPSPATWVYSLVPLKVGNATATPLGGIYNPDGHKIWYNADGATGHGVVDFTGNRVPDLTVYPEWWGAAGNATAANNTAALQAAIWAALGCGPNQCRINGNGLNIYDKTIYLGANYTINAELKMYHANGFKFVCGNRLSTGITQGGTNLRIIDGQSTSYGAFYDCAWSASTANTGALLDFDYTGSQGADLRPQFIDFYNNGFFGNGVTAIGVLLAKSGGGAQGSNVNFYDPAFAGFTTAALQVGTASTLAQNALAVTVYNGDFQGNPQYGLADYGGGYIQFHGTTFENGGFNQVAQTGADIFCSGPQGPVSVYDVRSESRKFLWCDNAEIYSSRTIDQALFPNPGGTYPVSDYEVVTGNRVTGDGAYYKVTANSSGFSGYGTPTVPVLASGGSASTLVDTNEFIAGARTSGIFTAAETVTQATTGASGTLLNLPASTVTVTGVATGQFVFGETVTQAVTGITAVETTPTPVTGGTSLKFSSISGTADGTHTWTGGTSGATFAPSGIPTFAASSPSMLISAHTGSPDNSHDWVGGTSGAHYTPTAVPAGTAWTVNTFAGQLVGIWTGTNINCYATIASNTANTLTITGSWVTHYPQTLCTAPDSTSTFIIEPAWSHAGTVTSGGMQMQYIAEDVIRGGATSTTPMLGLIKDSYFAGGQLHIANGATAKTKLENVTATRSDWYDTAGGNTPGTFNTNLDYDWDVRVIPLGAAAPINWALPSITGVMYSGALHKAFGTSPICWETGTVGSGANTTASESCIGGKSDRTAAATATRNILEVPAGMLGRPAAFGTDQAGTDMDFIGGPSTGTGAGGAINFWIANPGSTGSTPNSALKRWAISTDGHFLAGLDNTYDIGASGATRPRNGYFATAIIAPKYQTTLSTPTTSGDTCTAGQMWADASFVYVCTASNTIKRATLAAF